MTRPLHAVTHNSKFHADDVFSTVVLRKLYPDMHLTRTRDSEIIAAADIAYDLGGVYDHAARRYDHHQIGARKRADTGITYSAFGLIWDHYGLRYCEGDEEIWRYIDDVFVRGIDADDNGLTPSHPDMYAPEFTVPQIIRQLNPLAGSDEDYDEQFAKAEDLAKGMLERMHDRIKSEYKDARDVRVAQAKSPDPQYAELDHAIVMNDFVSEIDELNYLLFPDGANNGIWRLYAVNVPNEKYAIKRPFPKEWAGLRDEDLMRLTGVPDASFCHKNQFLVVARSREGVLALLEKALRNKEES